MIKILEDQKIFKIIPWEVDLKPRKTNMLTLPAFSLFDQKRTMYVNRLDIKYSISKLRCSKKENAQGIRKSFRFDPVTTCCCVNSNTDFIVSKGFMKT